MLSVRSYESVLFYRNRNDCLDDCPHEQMNGDLCELMHLLPADAVRRLLLCGFVALAHRAECSLLVFLSRLASIRRERISV